MGVDVKTIRERLLGFFPDTYDKSEGTVLWDIVQAYALDFNAEYSKVDDFKTNFFLKSVTDEELFDLKLSDYGEERKSATYAEGQITIIGTVGTYIVSGTLVASETAEYEIQENATIPKSGKITLGIKCVTIGTVGNASIGLINTFPITISGLNECYNESSIENAVDKEDMEVARARVQLKLEEPRTSGNQNDYKYWAEDITEVGTARTIPRWNGKNTVKVLIANRNNDIATDSLIKETYNYIESSRPIGADVTVESAKLKTVNIEISGLEIDTSINQTVEQIHINIQNTLKTYINSITLNDELISLAQCNKKVLETEGVADFLTLKLNDIVGTLNLSNDEIARFGTLTIDGVII